MSRPLRLEFPNALYHVTSRGDRCEDIYEEKSDRLDFLSIFASVIEQCNWVCYAYCLMDNHYHLLIETPDANLSKGMRQLNGVYTQRYNRKHNKSGHLFQGRYKAILVDEDAYLLELSRYIVLNPVKKGLVKQAKKWKWSSYAAMTGIEPVPTWLSADYVLLQFSKQRKRAIRKYESFVAEGLKRNSPIWNELSHQIYLGGSDFIDEVEQHMEGWDKDIQIPKAHKRPKPKVLSYYDRNAKSRNQALVAAYASGGYSYQELGNYFGLHFTTVGKIIRSSRQQSKN